MSTVISLYHLIQKRESYYIITLLAPHPPPKESYLKKIYEESVIGFIVECELICDNQSINGYFSFTYSCCNWPDSLRCQDLVAKGGRLTKLPTCYEAGLVHAL